MWVRITLNSSLVFRFIHIFFFVGCRGGSGSFIYSLDHWFPLFVVFRFGFGVCIISDVPSKVFTQLLSDWCTLEPTYVSKCAKLHHNWIMRSSSLHISYIAQPLFKITFTFIWCLSVHHNSFYSSKVHAAFPFAQYYKQICC